MCTPQPIDLIHVRRLDILWKSGPGAEDAGALLQDYALTARRMQDHPAHHDHHRQNCDYRLIKHRRGSY
jgi:hypothetical protein